MSEPDRARSATRTRLHRGHVAALLLYVLAALLLTWPLARRFATHMPGNGIDDPSLAWNLWWIKVRLVEQLNWDIFHVGWMFHPIDINLAFYTLTPLNGLLSMPLQTSASLVVANNLVLLSSFVLGGYGLFLLVQVIWRDTWTPQQTRLSPATLWWMAWLGGFIYAFAAPKLFYAALGQYNIASSQWLPFCLLYLWRVLSAPTLSRALRDGALAGIFLTLQAWAELTYASFLILLTFFVYGWVLIFWVLPQRVDQPARKLRNMTAAYATTAGVFLFGISPFLATMLPDLRVEGNFFASGGGFADVFSADLMGYLLPVRLHPLLGDWVASQPFPNDVGQQIFIGYSVLFLVALGWWSAQRVAGTQRRTANLWLGLFLFAFLLSLGPTLRFEGEALPVPGPFALVSHLPFFSGNRYPSRYSVVLLAAAGVLAARGLVYLAEHVRPPLLAWLPGLVVLVFVAEHVAIPLPLTDYHVPSIYQRLAEEPGDFAVLELPTGWRNGARVLGRSDELIMLQQWYQTTHGQRRLGGNTSRNPAYKFQYFSEEPVLADLIALMNADRDHIAAVLESEYDAMVVRDRVLLPDLLEFLGVRFVLLHEDEAPDLLARFVQDAMPVRLLETWEGEDWRSEPAAIRLYQVDPSQTDSVGGAAAPVNAGEPSAHRYLAEGWAPVGTTNDGRYATRTTPGLLLDLPDTGGTLTLSFGRDVTVRYALNGQSLGSQTGEIHRLEIPANVATRPVDQLSLFFETPGTAASALATSASAIGQTGVSLPPGLTLMVRSTGEEVGNFATIYLNGTQLAPNRRGYNLVALSPAGAVLASEVFDTHDPTGDTESAAMTAWLDQWPHGTIIVGAVADEASMSLSSNAVSALQRLGVATDLRGQFRQSHAFIGVQGAPPSSAVEATSLTHPATIWLGAPVDAPAVYGPLRSIQRDLSP